MDKKKRDKARGDILKNPINKKVDLFKLEWNYFPVFFLSHDQLHVRSSNKMERKQIRIYNPVRSLKFVFVAQGILSRISHFRLLD